MIEGSRVVHEVRYPYPVDDVWRALTEPAELATWLMPNDFLPEVGHRFHFDASPNFGRIEGEVLEIDPHPLLRCRWIIEGTPTTVTMRLRAEGDNTILRLEHDSLLPDPRAEFDGGWDSKLRHDLVLVLSGQREPDRQPPE